MIKPNDQRGFVHKRIGRGIKKFVTSGFNPVAAAGGFLESPSTAVSVRPATQLEVSRANSAAAVGGGGCGRLPPGVVQDLCIRISRGDVAPTKGGPPSRFFGITGGGCPPLMKRDLKGNCVLALGQQVGRDDVPVGDAVMGRYGAAYIPGNMVVNRALCLPGDVLGDDALCYPKRTITNRQREWPRGRKPLLTGGEMRAISIAARAGRRVELATKRLQKIGMMKKPAPRRKQVSSGSTEHHHHTG